jgi:hypothetical protein
VAGGYEITDHIMVSPPDLIQAHLNRWGITPQFD